MYSISSAPCSSGYCAMRYSKGPLLPRLRPGSRRQRYEGTTGRQNGNFATLHYKSERGRKSLPVPFWSYRGMLLSLLAAGCDRCPAAILTLKVNDGQTLGSADDTRRQHAAARTYHPDSRVWSSCHRSLLFPFRRRKRFDGFRPTPPPDSGAPDPITGALPTGIILVRRST